MTRIRAQYHFRRTDEGLAAWDVRRLIRLAQGLPVREVDPRQFAELDEDHWYAIGATRPTPRSILEHLQLIRECDLRQPILLDPRGRVMDGMHRICKAILENVEAIPAVQLPEDPAPDYVGRDPDDLPYDD